MSVSLALFGEDHLEPGAYAMAGVGLPSSGRPLTSCALSVGSVSALARKGGTEVPNEDCLFALDDGRFIVHIIADGHHGYESSHDFIEVLARLYDRHGPHLKPDEALALAADDWAKHSAPDLEASESRTTLLLTRVDRREGTLEGVNLGDSAVFLAGVETGVRRVAAANECYAAPWAPESLHPSMDCAFHAPARAGEWLLSCSDGVTECHYGMPDTSIQSTDLESLLIRAVGSTDTFVEALASLALTGVRGHPGGEDNLAIIASVI
jgi:hypothetical protein